MELAVTGVGVLVILGGVALAIIDFARRNAAHVAVAPSAPANVPHKPPVSDAAVTKFLNGEKNNDQEMAAAKQLCAIANRWEKVPTVYEKAHDLAKVIMASRTGAAT